MSKYSLIGVNGNAFSVIGFVRTVMKKENRTKEEIATYSDQAQSGDYDNLLCVSQDMIDSLKGEDLKKDARENYRSKTLTSTIQSV